VVINTCMLSMHRKHRTEFSPIVHKGNEYLVPVLSTYTPWKRVRGVRCLYETFVFSMHVMYVVVYAYACTLKAMHGWLDVGLRTSHGRYE